MLENRSVPPSSVIPLLAYPDVAEAADWLCRAFGFRVRLRVADHRAQLVLGDGAVIVTRSDGAVDGRSHGIHVRVDDARSHLNRAVAAGARIVHPLADHPYGERQYAAEDFAGHRWTFSQSTADVDPASWGATDVDLGQPGRPR